MKRIICSQVLCGVVGLCLLAGAGLAFGQERSSLADLARQEEARRRAQKRPTKVYTNADVPVVAAATAATATEVSATPKEGAEAPQEGPALATGATGAGVAASGVAQVQGSQAGSQATAQEGTASGPRPGVKAGDETQWRSRMNTARDPVTRAQLQFEAMRTRVLNLQTARAVGSSEPGTQALIQRQHQESLQEFDRLRADIEKYQKALADLEAQARAAGVPPGWLR